MLPQGLGNHPELVGFHVVNVRLERLEHDERGHIARRLRENHISRVEEDLRDEFERVLRAGCHDNVVDAGTDSLKGHHFENVLPQPREPLAGPVLQGGWASVVHDPFHCSDDEFAGKGGDERHTAGQ